MAVLVEAISVIVRADRLLEAFDGGWEAFKAIVPNDTLCADGELARVGFLAPDAVEHFCQVLEREGLVLFRDGQAADVVIADQQRGFTLPCDWAEIGTINWQGDPAKKTPCCRLMGSEVRQIITPDGWDWENSLLSDFRFVPEPTGAAAPGHGANNSVRYAITGEPENGEAGYGLYLRGVPRNDR